MARRDAEDLAGDGGDGRGLSRDDNKSGPKRGTSDAHGVARDELRSVVERIERLEEEKAVIADDIKDVYGEAKGNGYDTKAIKAIIKIRKQDKDERMEFESVLDTYLAALGMLDAPEEE